MYPRLAIVLFTIALGSAAQAFVRPPCGTNAEWNECGSACVPDCANPEPPKMCTLQCVMGCFCKPGFLKNANGECVLPEQCKEDIKPQPHIMMAENIAMPQCPDNEEFKACGSACAPTCANPRPSTVCTRQCVIGCFCKPGYLRNKYHVCVPADKCDAPATEQHNLEMFAYPPGYTPMPVEPEVCADKNEEFRQCKGCDDTCTGPVPCPRICKPGCACKHGHVRDAFRKCILKEQCSKMEMNNLAMFAYPPGYVPPVVEPKQCGENEEFRQCKGCDARCNRLHPICPMICVAGCACQQGHVRDNNGKCIPQEQCPKMNDFINFQMLPPNKCKDNEEFHVCGSACAPTCANPKPSPICTRQCVIGCFCKEGYLKNAQGECVPADKCNAPVETVTIPYGNDILCPTDREVYIDDDVAAQLDCMASCDTPLPYMIRGVPVTYKKCKEVKAAKTCVCRFPYFRNQEGKCVERKECHKETMTTTPSH